MAPAKYAAIGDGVTALQPGDRVCGTFFQNWIDGPPTPANIKGALGGDIDGTLAEYVLLKHSPASFAFPTTSASTKPPLSPAPPSPRGTRSSLQTSRPIPPSSSRAPAASPSSHCSSPKLQGRRVLGISSSDVKLQRACSLGLDKGLDYGETSEWDRWVLEQTNGEGVDLVVEVGGVGTLPRSLRAVKMGGFIAQIGVLSGPAEPIPIPLILHKQIRIQGIYVGSRKRFEEMNHAIAAAKLHPVFESAPMDRSSRSLSRNDFSHPLRKTDSKGPITNLPTKPVS